MVFDVLIDTRGQIDPDGELLLRVRSESIDHATSVVLASADSSEGSGGRSFRSAGNVRPGVADLCHQGIGANVHPAFDEITDGFIFFFKKFRRGGNALQVILETLGEESAVHETIARSVGMRTIKLEAEGGILVFGSVEIPAYRPVDIGRIPPVGALGDKLLSVIL